MNNTSKRRVKSVSMETFVFLFISVGMLLYMANIMGAGNMFKVIMNTAHDLLLNTVFLIMSLAVLSGALSALLSEFGVISLINKIFSVFMKPLYGLPGASIAGVLATYLSDNPAIVTFASEKSFRQYFKDYQLPLLCNLGTSFGMGLIVTVFMLSLGEEFVGAVIIGNVSAILGSIVSVRLLTPHAKKYYNYKEDTKSDDESKLLEYREIRDGNIFHRTLEAMLEGGKTGVELGMALIPGVLIVCTFVMMMTFGPSIDPQTGQEIYTGAAYEGIALLPFIGEKLSFILEPLFGFTSPEAIAFPITALGAVGAAISLIPQFLADNVITANDIAVFTAMGICWSGYLSTHIGMMDALNARGLASKAMLTQTIGGVLSGVFAHLIFSFIG